MATNIDVSIDIEATTPSLIKDIKMTDSVTNLESGDSTSPEGGSPPSSMDESMDEAPVPKGCGIGVFGYEGVPNGAMETVDPKVS